MSEPLLVPPRLRASWTIERRLGERYPAITNQLGSCQRHTTHKINGSNNNIYNFSFVASHK